MRDPLELIPRVKICCIASAEAAWLAIRCGASALGLVSAMPSGPGVIPEARIVEIAGAVPPPIATFLLTCSTDAEEVVEQQRRCRSNTVQLCDRLASGSYRDLRTGMPGIGIIQVIHVTGEGSVDEAIAASREVDAILLDSGNPLLPVKELGGTGRTHNWEWSRMIRERAQAPVFLAGGLTPENIAAAVYQVRPFGVDVCSGVRTEGRLDEEKLRRFFCALATTAG